MRLLHHAFRLYVAANQLESTVAFYETLQGIDCERRLSFPELGIEVALVGAFILLAGTDAALKPVRAAQALLVVDSLDDALGEMGAHGATVLHGPQDAPGGRNATVLHPDGLVAEYYESATTP